MRALFVYNPADLDAPVPGGVQRCSREFLDIVTAASEATVTFSVDYDHRFLTRLKRRTRLVPYAQYDPVRWRDALVEAVHEHAIDTVFLNRAELMRLVPMMASALPSVHAVLMSHGNESGDLLYEVGVHRARAHANHLKRIYDYVWLGGDLSAEAAARHSNVFTITTMSEEEAVLERWLGAQDVFVLPRVVKVGTHGWHPEPRRVGFVGSLHHTPNIVALRRVLATIAEHGIDLSLDLVGRPAAVGEALANEYGFVTYLGALSDVELAETMLRWSLFLNPILWLSKGASMKLADALAHGLPALTTQSGKRGYELPEGTVFTTCDDADAFAERLSALLDRPDELAAARTRLLQSAAAMPSIEGLAERLNAHLSSVRKRGETNALWPSPMPKVSSADA